MTEDEMVGWHYRLDGHEFEQVPGVGDGQKSLHGNRDPAQFSSVQSLSRVRLFATHGLQHARLPCLLPTSRACSNSCPLSQ